LFVLFGASLTEIRTYKNHGSKLTSSQRQMDYTLRSFPKLSISITRQLELSVKTPDDATQGHSSPEIPYLIEAFL